MRHMIKPLAAGMIAASLACGTALAAPITVTWDPAGASPSLNSGVSSIVHNNQVISDFSTTVINATTGAFTDTGYLPISEFQLNGAHVSSGGLGTNYSLYYAFTATGTFYYNGKPGFNPSASTASPDSAIFTALTYSLVGTNGTTSFSFGTNTANPTITAATGTTLATGSLSPSGGSTGSVGNGTPSAQVLATFNPLSSESGFFVTPPATGYVGLNLDSSFTNTTSVVSIADSGGDYYLQVNGGGGNANFAVPEPASVALLGTSILGLGLVARRKKIG